MRNVFYYNTKIGKLRIEDEGNYIVSVSTFDGNEPEQIQETALIKATYLQLKEYFDGKRTTFDIPIRLEGTSFQTKVWEALRKIPYGETRSYGEIAKQIGSPKGARAVGGANHNNPILIIVPCHRVIGASGALVGFGAGIPVKEMLLKLENHKM